MSYKIANWLELPIRNARPKLFCLEDMPEQIISWTTGTTEATGPFTFEPTGIEAFPVGDDDGFIQIDRPVTNITITGALTADAGMYYAPPTE